MAGKQEQLASQTLAELYLKQGHTAKALQVLHQLVAEEPENEKARRRLKQVEADYFAAAGLDEKRDRARNLARVLERVRKERGE